MTKKKILIIILVVLAIIFLFVLKKKGTKHVAVDPVNDPNISNLQNEFITALLSVQSISLDTDFLKSPMFKSLIASGASVNLNPPKGRSDPFSRTDNNIVEEPLNETIPTDTPSRVLDLGVKTETPTNNDLLSAVKINVSKITSSTATIGIIGIPNNTPVSIKIESPNSKTIELDVFTYKLFNQEYSIVATDLTSKIKYTVSITKPDIFKDIKAEFTTK